MKTLRLILAFIIISLSGYGLITAKIGALIPYILFFLVVMLLITGITELREKRKTTAIILYFITGFNFYVLLSILFHNPL